MASSAYFASMVVLPVIIDGPGPYVTRCGERVEITQSSTRHDFGCIGTYNCDTRERWHKSGRLFSGKETINDVVAKYEGDDTPQ